MSKKGRAKRTSGAPSSRPSVRAVADAEATKGSAPESASKEKASAAALPDPERASVTTAGDAAKEAPKSDAAKEDAPKSDAAKEDAPKSDATKEDTKSDAAKEDAPKSDAAKEDDAKSDAAKEDDAKSEPPKAAAPKSDTSDVDDEAFFTQGVRKSSIPPAMEADPADDRLVRLHEDPEVLARRAQGMKWVKIALAGFGALLAVGAVMKALEPPPAKPKDPVFVHAAGEPVPSAAASVEPAPSAAPSPSASSAPSDAAAGAAPDAAGDANAASDAAQAVAPAADLDGGGDASVDAKALKKACQRALDGGKTQEAISKCEASTAADPTDGEAWLLLGASYDQVGRKADARAAYQSCVQKGKRGPTGECAALLRQ
jgi:hypothetical protein